jgi:tripartite-type tricarboxylate transporter receptor subunit TctC
MMIAVRADGPVKSIADLTAALKEKGNKATYGYANPTSRVFGAMYKEKAGLQAVEVGYRTGADYLNELYSGKIDFAVVDNVQGMAQANAGRMLLLAVGADKRMQAAPDLPTMTELGYPMNIRSWWAALVPSGTPAPIVDQLNRWFSQVVASEETKTFLNGIASDPWVSKPEEAQAYFLQQIKDWGEWVRIANIEPQG